MNEMAWRGFKDGEWTHTIDVRDFIQKNYTPYEGDDSFLAGISEKTSRVWEKCRALIVEEVQKGIIGVEMPKKYVAEMFCDRLAASRVYRGKDFQLADPYLFFQRSMQKRLLIAPETAALLETMLLKLRDEGEDAAFSYIRYEVLGK